jgi:hypothetical protein
MAGQHPEHELLMLNAKAEELMQANNHQAALPLYRRFVERLQAHFGALHVDTLAGLNNLGVLLHQLHQYAEAEQVLTRALEGKRRLPPSGDGALADTCKNLADVYRDTARALAAAPLYREALSYSRARRGPSHPVTVELLDDLADCLEASDPAAALELLKEGLAARRKRSGDNAPDTQACKARVVHLLRDVFGRKKEASDLEELVGQGRAATTAATVGQMVRAVSGRNLVGGGGGGGGVLSSGGGGGGGGASSPLAQSQQSVAWGPAQGGGGGGGGGDLGVVANPLVLASMAAQRAPSSRSLSLAQQQFGGSPPQRDPTKVFKRCSDESDSWFVCEATGAAVWELPAGAIVEE